MQNCCVKKTVTIGLLAIYLFNQGGYSIFFHWMIIHSSKQTSAYINTGSFEEDELVHLKIPVLLPYSTNWNEYERYDGEIEYEGVYYHYVKRKIYNDTLHLLCLPDFKRTRLQKVENDYAFQGKNLNSNSEEKTINPAKRVLQSSEYDRHLINFSIVATSVSKSPLFSFVSPFLSDTDKEAPIHPPDSIA